MRKSLLLLTCALSLTPTASSFAANSADSPKAAATDDAVIAAVRAADDERLAATTAAKRERLEAIYSDLLYYGHSNGKVDTKATQITGIVSGPNVYESFDYKTRTFQVLAPGVVQMHGRVLVNVRVRETGAKSVLDLNYLAVWRQENGKWRFASWQSTRFPDASATKK